MKLTKNPNETNEAYTDRMVHEYWKSSWSAKRLKEAGHKLTDYGFWVVEGEDENPDLHGTHDVPYLGTFEGTLDDTIAEAVNLPKFYTWGGGGSITLRKEKRIKKVSIRASRREKARLREKIEKLQSQLDVLKKEYEEA